MDIKNIEDAFKELSLSDSAEILNEDLNEATYVIRNGEKVQKDYHGGFETGFEDLFDQVYCTLTHGGDKGFDRKVLGDLGSYKIKYDDENIGVDYSNDEFARIIVTDTTDRIQNAIIVAEIYGLDYEVRDAGDTSRVIISVPFDEPVNRSVFHYIDADNKLLDLVSANKKKVSNEDLDSQDQKPEDTANEETSSDISSETLVNENVETSMPATPLSEQEIYDFVDAIPEATGTRPPQAFKLGYIRELKREVAAKYRGGRGSEGEPNVRIFKATEYSRLYTKAPYENLGSTKAYRKETGKEAGHERTGFHSTDADSGNILNAIGSYPNGDLALQTYPMSDNKVKAAYFISIDDADLVPATKQDVAEYLVPAAASKILNSAAADSEAPRSADNINRFKLSGIYMIGNLGHSIIK